MISNPHIGMKVRIHYRKDLAPLMPWHGMVGLVVMRARGRGPRNHGVDVGGVLVVVPAGNLQKADE
jgi:hypothetical protein